MKYLFLIGIFYGFVMAQEKNEDSQALQSQTTSTITDSSNPCNHWKFKKRQSQSDILFYSTGEKWLVHTTFNDKEQPNGISKEYNRKGYLTAVRYYNQNGELVKRIKVSWWWGWWLVLTEKTKITLIITSIIVITLVISVSYYILRVKKFNLSF